MLGILICMFRQFPKSYNQTDSLTALPHLRSPSLRPAHRLFPLVRESGLPACALFSQPQLHGAEQSFIVFLKILLFSPAKM